MTKQPESLILRQVRDYLRLCGWLVIRIQQGIGCHKGISDLVLIREGRTVWAEVKTERGHLSAFQEAFSKEVEAHGGEYVVIRSLKDAIAMSGDPVLF